MGLLENFRVALGSVRDNWLRAILTMIIIAFGIMALVGILTAIDAAIYSLSSNLSSLGANTFSVEQKNLNIQGNRRGRRSKRSAPFSYQQANEFMERYAFPAQVSISFSATGTGVVKYGKLETNPNTILMGMTRNYLTVKGYQVALGRNFTDREVREGGNIAIIGSDLVNDLFGGKNSAALDKYIMAGDLKVKVIGVLATRGNSMNDSQDRRVLLPLQTAKRFFAGEDTNYDIIVSVGDPTKIEAAMAEATVTMRNVRRLRAGEDNDFELENSSSLVSIIKDNTVTLRLAAVSIGLMTLLGAAIGLMNIMLVSVTERTREIGVRKALGATSRNILVQFLVEATAICQLGGLLGILLGVLAGNIVILFTGGAFLVPWAWIVLALVVCTVVGLLSGIYPALRAAQLDPIESLRYE
ncbi:MAG: FtsX-like permease family protein [Lewinella sp.]|nr:FtsX-like permease family protein [Lewinella sp.]